MCSASLVLYNIIGMAPKGCQNTRVILIAICAVVRATCSRVKFNNATREKLQMLLLRSYCISFEFGPVPASFHYNVREVMRETLHHIYTVGLPCVRHT